MSELANSFPRRGRPPRVPLRITLVALLVALLAASSLLFPAARPAEARGYWQVMDREAYMITADTRVVRTRYDLRNGRSLRAVPYRLGAWRGADEQITNLETFPTLEADHVVHRRYADDGGHALLLTLIGGTKGTAFHHPLICYEQAGWPTEDWGTESVNVSGGTVVFRAVVGKDPRGPWQADLHGFLWPTTSRGWEHGTTMIRVTVFVRGEDVADAFAVGKRFARHLFAEVAAPGSVR